MSRKYRKSKRTYKKKYKKSVPRPLGGFPDRQVVKLRYVDSNLTLDPSAGSSDTNVYILNSIYDPDFTSLLNHQPMCYDEWTNLYSHYTVLSAKISVMAKPAGSTNIIPPAFGVAISPSSSPLSAFSTIDNVLESKISAGWKIASVSQPAGSMNTYPTVTKNVRMNRFFGTDNVRDGAAYGASTGSTPAQPCYASVWSASLDGGNAGEITAIVTIDYVVEFSKRKGIDGS